MFFLLTISRDVNQQKSLLKTAGRTDNNNSYLNIHPTCLTQNLSAKFDSPFNIDVFVNFFADIYIAFLRINC